MKKNNYIVGIILLVVVASGLLLPQSVLACGGNGCVRALEPTYVEVIPFPRLEGDLLDWCYYNGQQCGHRVAQAYCVRHGFMHQAGFKMACNLDRTRLTGTGKLCNSNCAGFAWIRCVGGGYRPESINYYDHYPVYRPCAHGPCYCEPHRGCAYYHYNVKYVDDKYYGRKYQDDNLY